MVITLVSDGTRCLLVRQSSFPKGMYSALAGFCDIGKEFRHIQITLKEMKAYQLYIYIYIYICIFFFWLHWVSVAVLRLFLVVVDGLLIEVASLVAEQDSRPHGLSSCGGWARELQLAGSRARA